MKRRLLQTILAISLALSVLGTSAMAAVSGETATTSPNGVVVSETVENLPDGSSIVTTVIDETPITPYGTVYNKTGSKVYSARNSSGTIMWQFTVTGTFTVNSGVSATARVASHTHNILEDAWQYQTGYARCSGNQAIGDATFVRKVLLVTIESRSCTVTLTCSNTGVLS